MNISKDVWHCHACGSGGGWMELLAVAEGVIRCDQAGPGVLTAKQRRELIEIAESRGLIKHGFQMKHLTLTSFQIEL